MHRQHVPDPLCQGYAAVTRWESGIIDVFLGAVATIEMPCDLRRQFTFVLKSSPESLPLSGIPTSVVQRPAGHGR